MSDTDRANDILLKAQKWAEEKFKETGTLDGNPYEISEEDHLILMRGLEGYDGREINCNDRFGHMRITCPHEIANQDKIRDENLAKEVKTLTDNICDISSDIKENACLGIKCGIVPLVRKECRQYVKTPQAMKEILSNPKLSKFKKGEIYGLDKISRHFLKYAE